MEPSTFKTPSRKMAAFITVVLLMLFAASYILPALTFSWINQSAKFDAGLQQTLLTLLVLAVGYYIGSSKGSADSGDALRQIAASSPVVATVATPDAKPGEPKGFTVTTGAGP